MSSIVYLILSKITDVTLASSELIPGLHPANERRRYKVNVSLIG